MGAVGAKAALFLAISCLVPRCCFSRMPLALLCTTVTVPAPLLLLLPPLQFVLTTDPSVGAMVEQLQYIYSALFVELVAKNPLYTPGEAFL